MKNGSFSPGEKWVISPICKKQIWEQGMESSLPNTMLILQLPTNYYKKCNSIQDGTMPHPISIPGVLKVQIKTP